MIERNKKRKKGAPEEPVPFVFEARESGSGHCIVKNQTLKILNMASSGIKEAGAQHLRKFV